MPTVRRKLLASFVALALVLPSAHAAHAEPSPAARAAEIKTQGDAAMDALRYDEAIALYTQAWELGQDPAVLYNRGRVHQARGDFPRALEDLERFDRDAPAPLKARVPKLAELLGEVRGKVATLALQVNVPGARVLVRGVVVGETPLAPLKLNAGPATLEVAAGGYTPVRRDLVLVGGTQHAVDLSLTKVATDGVLVVTVDREPGVVLVDGERVGTTPIEVSRAAGTHRIVLQRDGESPVEASVVLEAAARKDVRFPAPDRRSITGAWWFWTGIAVVAVGGAVTVYALTREKSAPSGESFSPGQVAAPLLRF